MTVPQNVTGRAPAVILVGGPGRQDRDETMYGVSIFGQLAGRLAEAGYLVVRFDKRGLGQSGGRTEHAGIPEYAEDLIAVVAWLRKREDVDSERIAVVSHAEGAAVALAAAQREKRIKSLALMAAPGRTGREFSLEQQQRLLERLKESPPEAQAKIALQMRIMDAVVTGKGLGDAPARAAAAGRYALVQELAAVRSVGRDREDRAADPDRPRIARYDHSAGACGPAGGPGARAEEVPAASNRKLIVAAASITS